MRYYLISRTLLKRVQFLQSCLTPELTYMLPVLQLNMICHSWIFELLTIFEGDGACADIEPLYHKQVREVFHHKYHNAMPTEL